MIKDFETIKKQLHDLSGVINSFKSESVQLKVVELLFKRMGIDSESESPAEHHPPKKRRVSHNEPPPNTANGKKPRKPRASKGGRPGPGAMVSQLKDKGFFDKPKTIQNIIDHCHSKFAYTYKSNELSVTMTRALRNGTLKRRKDADKQFEYYTE